MTQLYVKPAQEEKGGGEESIGKGKGRQESELHRRNPSLHGKKSQSTEQEPLAEAEIKEERACACSVASVVSNSVRPYGL